MGLGCLPERPALARPTAYRPAYHRPGPLGTLMMITTKMEEMAGAGEADVRNPTLGDHRSQEILLPVLGQC